MLGREQSKAELRLTVAFERPGDRRQVTRQIGRDGGGTALEDGFFLEHVELDGRRAKAVDLERQIEDAVAAADEEPIAVLGQQHADLTAAGGPRLVDRAGHGDDGLVGRPIAPDDLQVHGAGRRMRVELDAHRASMTDANHLLLADPVEHLFALGVDQQPVDHQVVAPREQTLEVGLARDHVMAAARRRAAVADLGFIHRLRDTALSAAHAHVEDAAQLVGVLDGDGDVAALSQQREDGQAEQQSDDPVRAEAQPPVVDEAQGQREQGVLPALRQPLDERDDARIDPLPTRRLRLDARRRGPHRDGLERAARELESAGQAHAALGECPGLRRVRGERIQHGQRVGESAVRGVEAREVEAEADLIRRAARGLESAQEGPFGPQDVAAAGEVRGQAVPVVDEHAVPDLDHARVGASGRGRSARRVEQRRGVLRGAAQDRGTVRRADVRGADEDAIARDELGFEAGQLRAAALGGAGDRRLAPGADGRPAGVVVDPIATVEPAPRPHQRVRRRCLRRARQNDRRRQAQQREPPTPESSGRTPGRPGLSGIEVGFRRTPPPGPPVRHLAVRRHRGCAGRRCRAGIAR